MSKPIHRTFRNGISTAVFENKLPDGMVARTVVPQRSYKDKDGNWQNTHSFPVNGKLKELIGQLQAVYDEFAPKGEEFPETPEQANNAV